MQTPSENTEVKLNTLDEPAAHLIEDNVVLPEDIFRSYLGYLLYEMAHCILIMFLSLAIGVSILMIALFDDNLICIIFSATTICICWLAFPVVIVETFLKPIKHQEFTLKLLVEVIARKPAGKEWRTVTYNMNQNLFDKGLWNTPYYFYSSDKCHEFFATVIKEVNSDSYSNPSSNNTQNTQSSSSPKNASKRRAYFHSIKSNPIYMAYILKATQIEKEAQSEYWRKQYPDADLV